METIGAKERDIKEGNHAMKDVVQYYSNGDQININSIPWMFMEQQLMLLKK